MLRADSALPVVEEVQIKDLRVGRDLSGYSTRREIDLGRDLLPVAVLPSAGVSSEGEFGGCDRDLGLEGGPRFLRGVSLIGDRGPIVIHLGLFYQSRLLRNNVYRKRKFADLRNKILGESSILLFLSFHLRERGF